MSNHDEMKEFRRGTLLREEMDPTADTALQMARKSGTMPQSRMRNAVVSVRVAHPIHTL